MDFGLTGPLDKVIQFSHGSVPVNKYDVKLIPIKFTLSYAFVEAESLRYFGTSLTLADLEGHQRDSGALSQRDDGKGRV